MRNLLLRRSLQSSNRILQRRTLSSLFLSPSSPPKPPQKTHFSSSSLINGPSPPQEIKTHLPNPQENEEREELEEEEGPMNEFLSRFTTEMRENLRNAFPERAREAIDEILLKITQKVVSEMEKNNGIISPVIHSDVSLDIGDDLWREVYEISKKSFEGTRRTRRRREMKRFLHCDDVKTMCRFAGEVGIRGDMLKELRFKWASEKLEEFDFYRNLERIRECDGRVEQAETTSVMAIPQRRGRLNCAVDGLDLISDKINDEEVKMVMGKCRLIMEKIVGLEEEDEVGQLLSEWVELLRPGRADWLAFLDRLRDQNLSVYFKVAELALDEQSFKPTIGDYAKLMDAYAKAGNIEKAEHILEKTAEKGIEADIHVLVILLQMYCDSGNLDRAKDTFEKLRDQGFQPDLNTYRSMIMAYVNSGLPKAAENLIREMEARDIKPTLELYKTLLQAFAQKGHVDSAQRMFNNMQFSGIQPDLEACTLLLEAYGQAGDAEQARHSFDFLRKAGHKPDDRCVGSMLAAYQKKNHLDKALDLILNLEKEGFDPGVATYAVLVDWLGRLQLVEEAEQVSEKIVGDVPIRVSVSLCSMYARAGAKQKALELLRVVEEEKERLTGEQFERVIDGLVAGGFHEEAKRIHGSMQSLGFSASESLRIALMAGPMVSRYRPGSLPK